MNRKVKDLSSFFRLVPNVGLEDDSPSSKSECSPEDDTKEDMHPCMVDGNAATTVKEEIASTPSQPDVTETQRSPQHYAFTNGERKRRKLPEIPKNRKCEYIVSFQHFTQITCGKHHRSYHLTNKLATSNNNMLMDSTATALMQLILSQIFMVIGNC